MELVWLELLISIDGTLGLIELVELISVEGLRSESSLKLNGSIAKYWLNFLNVIICDCKLNDDPENDNPGWLGKREFLKRVSI